MNAYYGSSSYCEQYSSELDDSYWNNSVYSDWPMQMAPYQPPHNAKFCSEDNIDDCFLQVNKMLRNMCLPSINEEDNKLVSLINACSDLVNRNQRDGKIREELEARTRRTMSDYDQLQTAQLRLKDDIERLEREVALRHEKEKDLATKNRSVCSSLKSEKDEVKRLHSVINHRESQYKHDSKKNEREMNRLKEKLNQVLMEKSHKLINNEVINILPKTDGKRGTWKTSANPEELYKLMLRDYEEKMKELIEENRDLRSCLDKMQQQLEAIVQQNNMQLDQEDDSSSDVDMETPTDRKCDSVPNGEVASVNYLPFEISKEIMRKFNKTCSILKKYLKAKSKEIDNFCADVPPPSENAEPTPDQQAELTALRKEVEEYKYIIDLQEQVLQKKIFHNEKFHQLKQQLLEWTPQRGRSQKSISCHNTCTSRLLPAIPTDPMSLNSLFQNPTTASLYKNISLYKDQLAIKNSANENTDDADSGMQQQLHNRSHRPPSPSQYSSEQLNLNKSNSLSSPRSTQGLNSSNCLTTNSLPCSPSSRRMSAPIISVPPTCTSTTNSCNSTMLCSLPNLRRSTNFLSLSSLNDSSFLLAEPTSPQMRMRSRSAHEQSSP